MKYLRYSVEDFVLDKSFRKWVLDPDPATRNYWSQWLKDHPEKAPIVSQAIALLHQIPEEHHRLNEHELQKLSQGIEEGIDNWERQKENSSDDSIIPISAYASSKNNLKHTNSTFRKIKSVHIKIAACFIFLLGMGYLMYQEGTLFTDEPITYQQITKETQKGQKLNLSLPDGTKVMLNADSRITYNQAFGRTSREVQLEGEAFFDVVKDSLRPFSVHHTGFVTTALGTSFNISSYKNTDYIAIALASGKVQVIQKNAPKDSIYVLEPGEQLSYHEKQDSVSLNAFNPKAVLAWKEGIIYLSHADEQRVISTLERWYGLNFKVLGESKSKWNVSAKFDNQSLKSVLKSLSYTMDFSYSIQEDTVKITYN